MKISIFLWLFTLIFPALNIKLQVGSQIWLQNSFELKCSGAKGQVNYIVDNLPPGIIINDHKIQVRDRKLLKSERFPVKIKVIDSKGFVDQKLAVIILKDNNLAKSNVNSNVQNSNQIKMDIEATQNNLRAEFKNQRQSKNTKINIANNLDSVSNSQTLTPVPSSQNNLHFLHQKLNKDQVYKILNQINVPLNLDSVFPKENHQQNSVSIMLTNSDPGLINPTPYLIQNQKATPSSANRRQITEDQVHSRAVFQRQKAANAAISNLLTIIKRSTANRNSIRQQFFKFQDIYKQAQQKSQSANKTVYDSQNQYDRLNMILKNYMTGYSQMKNKLSALEVQNRYNLMEKQSLIKGIQKAQGKANAIKLQIQQIQRNLTKINKQKKFKDLQCENLQKLVTQIQKEGKTNRDQMGAVNQKLELTKAKVQQKKQIVNELRKKLVTAQSELRQSQVALSQYESQTGQYRKYFQQYQIRINEARRKSIACPRQIQQIIQKKRTIQSTQLKSLNQDNQKGQEVLTQVTKKLVKVTEQTDSFPKIAQQFKLQSQKIQSQIQAITQSIKAQENKLMNAKRIYQDSANELKTAEQNLQAAKNKYDQQSKNIEQGNKNLQIARTQKSKADQAINQLIRRGASLSQYLPFSIQSIQANPYLNTKDESVTHTSWQNNQGRRGNIQYSNQNSAIPHGQGNSIQIKQNSDYLDIQQIPNQYANINYNIEEKKDTINIPQESTWPQQLNSANINMDNILLFRSQNIDVINSNKDGSFNIKNMPEFVYRFFGPQIKSPQITNNIIYSSSISNSASPSLQNMLLAHKNANIPRWSYLGTITAAWQNKFTMLTDNGTVIQVEITDSTNCFKTQPILSMKPGVKAIVRGVIQNNYKIEASLVLFYKD